MLAVTTLRQIVVYVQEEMYQEFVDMKSTNRRLSFSELGEKAFHIAMPSLKKEFVHFNGPAQGLHGKRRRQTA